MFVGHSDTIEKVKQEHPLMSGVEKQILIGAKEGWDDYVMRQFTLQQGGYTPRHNHKWPHIMYIVKGEGTLFMGGKEYPIKGGSVAYVSSNIEHQVLNKGHGEFVFLCIVPKEGEA